MNADEDGDSWDTIPDSEVDTSGTTHCGFVPPPMPAYPVPQPEPGPTPQQGNVPSISEDDAREAFVLYASNHCCYKKSPAKKGVITNMEAFDTYRYELETFAEKRSTEWSHEPYCGQTVDAHTGPPPRLWDVATKSPHFFHDDKQVIKVPKTSSVKNCHDCMGMGRTPCGDCAGAGNRWCEECNGSGLCMRYDADAMIRMPCENCRGFGTVDCSECLGRGTIVCSTCRGQRQLLVFQNLIVKWKNHATWYGVEQSSGLQMEKLGDVYGTEVFRDTHNLVNPVVEFPDREVVRASEELVREHQEKYSHNGRRIVQQRQIIELIPITKVTYDWKGSSHVYYVYGNELRVKAYDYPATCCCSVM